MSKTVRNLQNHFIQFIKLKCLILHSKYYVTVPWSQPDEFRTHHSTPLFIYRYLLTPGCRVLLEKLTGLQLVKKFPAFYGTRRFITALTSVRHLYLSWASSIQSTYPHPTSCRSIVILSTHLRLGLPSGLFPSGFPTKTLYATLSSPIRPIYIHFNIMPPHWFKNCNK